MLIPRDGIAIRLQLAANGQWEDALRIEPSGIAPLDAWLQEAPADVALECFFDACDAPVQFLGIRLERLDPSARIDLIRTVTRGFLERPHTAGEICDLLQSCLAGQHLFQGGPAFLELGKLDAWTSFGSLRFWSAGDRRSPATALQEEVGRQARFHGSTDLPLAIEAGFAGSLPHWWGIVVSDHRADGWHTDFRQAGLLSEALPSLRQ